MLVEDLLADNAEKHTSVGYKNRAMKHKLSLKPHLIYASYINEEAHRWRNNVCGTICDNDAFYGFVLSRNLYNNAIKNLINEYTQTLQRQYSYR